MRQIERQLLSWPVSVIADDCWAGQFYRRLKLPYLTPIVGLAVEPREYIRFIKNLHLKDAFDLAFIPSERPYPVGRTPYATLHFMHFASEQEALDKFSRRSARIVWDRLYTKIDFGKPGYTLDDVGEWNRLKLSNSVALYPSASEFSAHPIHNGVSIPDWILNGEAMFQISKRHFDLFYWLKHGKIRSTLRSAIFGHFLSL
jgi:uncharacterized protein (DUF1919 family)